MMKHKYNKSSYNCCVYHKKVLDGTLIYLLLYVNAILIVARDIEEIKKLKTLLNTKFYMKAWGAAQKILEMEIIRDRMQQKFFLSQKKYIQKIISSFGMATAKPLKSP